LVAVAAARIDPLSVPPIGYLHVRKAVLDQDKAASIEDATAAFDGGALIPTSMHYDKILLPMPMYCNPLL